MILWIYMTKTVFISGLLYGYYWLFLRNRYFHDFNRLFLLSIPVLGFILPALYLPLPSFWNHVDAGSPIRLLGVGHGKLEEAVTIYAKQQPGPGISWEFILYTISGLVTLFLFIRLSKIIRYLSRLRTGKNYLQLPEARVYFVTEKGTPFSFFKSIFWGKEMDMNSTAGKQILRHELFHVKNNHSLDILFMEIFSVLCWFNLFLHFIRREIQAIHEYAADAFAAKETNGYEYASLLLMKVSGSPHQLTNPFFKNQIKRRITMITKTRENKKGLLGRIMILPLIAILICLFSFKFQTHFLSVKSKPIRVVIDAGHGGDYPGVSFNNIQEKNINLLIAKKIQLLSKDYSVEVIMTREKDENIGTGDVKSSLNSRVALAAKNNADLFISIHANGTSQGILQNKYSGFQIYVPDNSSKVFSGSVKLASVIADYIKPDYAMDDELKQRKGRILVLDKATVPAILIECGYMDNESDLKYLQDEKNQEKIARDILEGIRKYSLHSATTWNMAQNQTDTFSYEEYVKMNPKGISGVEINDKSDYMTVRFTDGKKIIVKITSAVREKWATELKNNQASPVFTKVQVEAEFPGGQQGWYDYLVKNLKYPDAAVSNEIQGEVVVEFIVRKNGTLSGIHALSGPEQLRMESVRIIRESGKWIPARNNGDIVESYCRQPVNYKLETK
jgi:N-acetylmuramoyl-L-alanine amidase